MADALMAYPELRHPFERTPIHPEGSATVLYAGRTVQVAECGSTSATDDRLLIQPDALPSINGFELKPEGACFEDICVPLPDALMVEQDGAQWFDLTGFADLVQQPYVADLEHRVWSFAEMPSRRENTLINAMAPDFQVTDRQGNVVTLADLKGKKALIVTWSSW